MIHHRWKFDIMSVTLTVSALTLKLFQMYKKILCRIYCIDIHDITLIKMWGLLYFCKCYLRYLDSWFHRYVWLLTLTLRWREYDILQIKGTCIPFFVKTQQAVSEETWRTDLWRRLQNILHFWAHLRDVVTKWAIVIRPSVNFCFKAYTSQASYLIPLNFHRNDPLAIFYKKLGHQVKLCKNLLLSCLLSNFIETSQEWSLDESLPKLLKQPWPN